MKRIFLITDYRGTFYSDVSGTGVQRSSMDISVLINLFRLRGIEVKVHTFVEIQDKLKSFKDEFVIYQSSEDAGLLYKNYLDSLVYSLHLAGAKLIPSYPLFKAHHNKVFMELLRKLNDNDKINNLPSKVYGTYEEFEKDSTVFPVVIKRSEGAGSRSVFLAKNESEKLDIAKKVSRNARFFENIRQRVKNFKYRNSEVKGHTIFRTNFIAQNFIPDLSGDFKVLVFDKKYYVLKRGNRKNDFRASGSGKFNWPEEIPGDLLDYSRSLFQSFDTPIASFDIAHDGHEYYLIEFQFMSFGPLTMSGSKHYFTEVENRWTKIESASDYHQELVNSVSNYILSKSTSYGEHE